MSCSTLGCSWSFVKNNNIRLQLRSWWHVSFSPPGVPLTADRCQWLKMAHPSKLVSLLYCSWSRVNTEIFTFTAAWACVTGGITTAFQWVTHHCIDGSVNLYLENLNLCFLPPCSLAEIGASAHCPALLLWSLSQLDQLLVSMAPGLRAHSSSEYS